MPFDFSQPPPQARTLEEAQELINALWAVAGLQAKQIEEQARQIAELSSKVIELTEKVRALEEKLPTSSLSH
jgi:cell division protein FtsB